MGKRKKGHIIPVSAGGGFTLEERILADPSALTDNYPPGKRLLVYPYSFSDQAVKLANILNETNQISLQYPMAASPSTAEIDSPLHRGGWCRSLERPDQPSFAERHNIPYPLSLRAKGLDQLRIAYDQILEYYRVTDFPDTPRVFIKLIDAAGGCGVDIATDASDLERIYQYHLDRGVHQLFPDNTKVFEVQASLGDKLAIVSAQFTHGVLRTPGGITRQELDPTDPTAWQGNIWRSITDPEIQRQVTSTHQRIINGISQETGTEPFMLTGGFDGAIVSTPSGPQLVVFEINVPRMTGAHIPNMLIQELGLPEIVLSTKHPGQVRCDFASVMQFLELHSLLITPYRKHGCLPLEVTRFGIRMLIHAPSENECVRINDFITNELHREQYMVP